MISAAQTSSYFCWLVVAGKKKSGAPPLLDLPSQGLSKMRKMGKCFMSTVFSCQKLKRRAKESLERYPDTPWEDVAGIKVCHFVRNDHKTAPF